MRECKQNQCIFLKLKQGCHKCSFCSVEPFIIAEDCPDCYRCENVPNSCRWVEGKKQEKEKEKSKKQDKKQLVEVKAK